MGKNKVVDTIQDNLIYHGSSLGFSNVGVEVLSDGQSATVARVSISNETDGYYTALASAVCAEDDDFDLNIGRNIAVGRAVRQLGRLILSEGQDAVHAKDRQKRKQKEASEKAAKAAEKRRKAAEKQHKDKRSKVK